MTGLGSAVFLGAFFECGSVRGSEQRRQINRRVSDSVRHSRGRDTVSPMRVRIHADPDESVHGSNVSL